MIQAFVYSHLLFIVHLLCTLPRKWRGRRSHDWVIRCCYYRMDSENDFKAQRNNMFFGPLLQTLSKHHTCAHTMTSVNGSAISDDIGGSVVAIQKLAACSKTPYLSQPIRPVLYSDQSHCGVSRLVWDHLICLLTSQDLSGG